MSSTSGVLTTPVGGQIAFPAYTPATGAANMAVTVDLAQSTQYGDAFSVNSVTQDGYTTGRLIGIDIDDTGIVQARFTNGNSQPLGQVAVANFANPQGLKPLGGNLVDAKSVAESAWDRIEERARKVREAVSAARN